MYDSHKKTSKGNVLLTHLPAYHDFDVDVNISGIEDTLSLLNSAGTRTVKLRPAQVAYLSFPIIGTGDIEGTVYLQDESGKRKPFRGALVNLYKDGTLVNNKVSEFDGYYSFPQVPLGTYQIQLDPDQAAELELQQQKEITITLKDIEQLEVHDMVLVNNPAEQTVSETPSTTSPDQETKFSVLAAQRKAKQLAAQIKDTSVAQQQPTPTLENSNEKLPTSVLEDVWKMEEEDTAPEEQLPASVLEDVWKMEEKETMNKEQLPTSVLKDVWILETSEEEPQEKLSTSDGEEVSQKALGTSTPRATWWSKIKQKIRPYHNRH